MSENFKIETPIGEIIIPYSEDKILNLYTKLVNHLLRKKETQIEVEKYYKMQTMLLALSAI